MRNLAGILITFIAILFLVNATDVFATPVGTDCNPSAPVCDAGLICKIKDPNVPTGLTAGTCTSAGGSIIVSPPEKGFAKLGDAVSKGLTVVFAVAVLIVLVMLILGAFEWITSGGDKEAVGKARTRIINALIGLAVLAVAFALTNVAARFTGLDLFNISIPTPNPLAPGL